MDWARLATIHPIRPPAQTKTPFRPALGHPGDQAAGKPHPHRTQKAARSMAQAMGRAARVAGSGRGCRRQEHASSPRLPAGSCALSPQSREPRRDFLNVFTNRPGLNPDGIASINALVSRRRRARKRRHRSPKDPRTWGNQRTRCRCTPKPGSLLRTACQLLGVSCSTLRGNCPALSQAGPRPGGVRAPGLWQDLRSKPAGRLLRWRHEHHPRPG
jgi:hypothetical protein